MAYTVRRGLIVTNGTEKHHRLVSMIARFMVRSMNIDPLDVYTEYKVGKFRFDVRWEDRLFEAETSVRGLPKNSEKMEALRSTGKRVTFVFPYVPQSAKIPFYTPYRRWSDVIEEVWLFDEDSKNLMKILKVPPLNKDQINPKMEEEPVKL